MWKVYSCWGRRSFCWYMGCACDTQPSDCRDSTHSWTTQSMVGAKTKERWMEQVTTLRRCLTKDCLKYFKRCYSVDLSTVFLKNSSNDLNMILFLHFVKAQTFLLGIKCSQHWAWYHKNTVCKKKKCADTVKINSFLGSGVFWILMVVNWTEKLAFLLFLL